MKELNKVNDQELIEKDYYVKTLAYYLKNWEAHKGYFHYHDHLEIMYIVKGHCVVELDDKVIPMKSGDYIIINSRKEHKLIVQDFCRIMNYEFCLERNPLKSLVSLSTLLRHSEHYQEVLNHNLDYIYMKDYEDIKGIIKRIILNQQSKGNDSDLFNQILVAELLVNVGKELGSHHYEDQRSMVYVRKAVDYLETHYDVDIKIEQIGRHIGIHENYLQRIFKEQMSMTIVDYVTKVRMEKAKMLLIGTNIDISMIPEFVGINSVQYFIKLFKRHYDNTPLQFRRRFKKDFQNDSYKQSTKRCPLQEVV